MQIDEVGNCLLGELQLARLDDPGAMQAEMMGPAGFVFAGLVEPVGAAAPRAPGPAAVVAARR